jgi:hypothetical protein
MTKLTLSVDENVVREAKRYAAAKRTTVSRIVSNLFESLAEPAKLNTKVHGPLTRRLLGMASNGKTEFRSAKVLLANALIEKHLGRTGR